MGVYFDDVHASWHSQLAGAPHETPDSAEVEARRAALKDGEDYLALGEALSRQLRYREAIEAYDKAESLMPGELRVYRGRAGRYLSTLQPENAKADFIRCLELGGERLDCIYRIGLCDYYIGNYSDSIASFEEAMPLCDDEMGVAVIYWHTLCSLRSNTSPGLLEKYRAGMEVGHHTAYDKAVMLFTGAITADELLVQLEAEPDDMEYAIILYGICVHLHSVGLWRKADALMEALLSRDAFWFCYSYLAAWNDRHNKGR